MRKSECKVIQNLTRVVDVLSFNSVHIFFRTKISCLSFVYVEFDPEKL